MTKIIIYITLVFLCVFTLQPIKANSGKPSVLIIDDPQVVIDNLQYEMNDYRLTAPIFTCRAMCFMSYHFLTSAGYDCQILRVLWMETGHAVIESDHFPPDCFYEATQKRFHTKSGYDTSNTYLISYSDEWITWYDWRHTRGDISQDKNINILDFFLFAKAYDSEIIEERYEMLGDMDLDGDVDLVDFFLFAQAYNN